MVLSPFILAGNSAHVIELSIQEGAWHSPVSVWTPSLRQQSPSPQYLREDTESHAEECVLPKVPGIYWKL